MPPVLFCSVNCGDGDVVSEFYKVTIPIVSTAFNDYQNGVLYQFALSTGVRCEWNRVTPGRNGWLLEKLSRYPNGWTLLGGSPNPGKWTWRLSIDLLVPLPDLHGWLHQFDRFVPPAVDPGHNCTIEQALQTYVPLSTDPDATITPTALLPASFTFRRHTNPCFCKSDCPRERRPPQKWFIQTTAVPSEPAYALGKLFVPKTISDDFCQWEAADTSPSAGVETLTRQSVAPLFGADNCWGINLTVSLTAGLIIFTSVPQWNDTGDELEGFDALCDVPRIVTSDLPPSTATITPVPWFLCGDVEARAWIASHS